MNTPNRNYHPNPCICDELGTRERCDHEGCCIMEREFELREPPNEANDYVALGMQMPGVTE